jgi:hypothetical protein
MPNVAIHANFLSGIFFVRLPAPNKDARRWKYWIHVGQNPAGEWIAQVQHQITGMETPQDVGEYPVTEIGDTFATNLAKQIAAQTPAPAATRAGRQFPEDCNIQQTVWVVTLQGADKAGNPKQADVVITREQMQDGLNVRPEPCTARVRCKTVPENDDWYAVPCQGMNPQDAGDAAVAACKWIRWN